VAIPEAQDTERAYVRHAQRERRERGDLSVLKLLDGLPSRSIDSGALFERDSSPSVALSNQCTSHHTQQRREESRAEEVRSEGEGGSEGEGPVGILRDTDHGDRCVESLPTWLHTLRDDQSLRGRQRGMEGTMRKICEFMLLTITPTPPAF
jgi:hypothetical protein